MKLFVKLGSIALMSTIVSSANSADITLNAGVGLQFVTQTIDDKTQNTEIDSSNIILRPFIAFSYDARDLDILATATHNHIRRSLDDENVTNNFTDFNYTGRYQIVRNLLNLQTSGAQSYRSQGANSFLVDNFLLNAERLRKNTTNNTTLNFNTPAGDYFGMNAQIGVNRAKSELASSDPLDNINQTVLETDGYSGSLQIVSGKDLRPLSYQLSGNLRGINRQNQQDFESQIFNARIGSNITSSISLRLLGFYENNDISNTQATGDNVGALREFYSYGAGIAWQSSENRFIELGFNRSITAGRIGEEDEEDDFVSVDMQWNFSARTRISGNYSRRFFGNSGNFRFSHNLRNWRSSIVYNESVTSNSQLLLNQEEGLLVCSNGSTDIADCSLSDSLDPSDLGPNEVLVPFVIDGFELNDRIIIRKSLGAQTSIDLRRTTIAASVTESTNEEVEVDRQVDTSSARLSGALKIGSRSTLTGALSYSDIQRTFEGEVQASIIKQATLDFERRLTRRLFASIGLSILDRSGDNVGNAGGIQGINGPLTDRRITAEIRYEFDSNR